MKKPSVNLKNSWQDNQELRITKEREWIECLVSQKIKKDKKLFTRFINILKKVF